MFNDKNSLIDIESQEHMLNYFKNVLESSCRVVDQDYLMNFRHLAGARGSTCVMVLVVGDRLICMNIGDSRALLSRNKSVIQLSRDHKPVNHS